MANAAPCSQGKLSQTRPRAKKKPGQPARANAFPTLTRRYKSGSNLAERLGHAGLDRLNGVGGDLLRDRGQFLAVLGNGLELLARMRGRQLKGFRERLDGDELAEEVEGGIGVQAGRVDELEAVFRGALGGRGIGLFEHVGRL